MSASTFETLPHTEAPSSGVFERLDSFIVAAKHLESSLAQERTNCRRLKQELIDRENSHDRVRKELESKVRELSTVESRLRAALAGFQENERALNHRLNQLTSDFHRVRDELLQYRGAWTEVLEREREAKMILADSEVQSRKRVELEGAIQQYAAALRAERAKRERAERHSESYQLELKNALIRIHSAEAKFSELTRELAAHRQSKQNADEEIAKIERSIRERLDWETLKEREKFRADMEREMAAERERFRDECRERIRAEETDRFSRSRTEESERLARGRESLSQELLTARAALDQANAECASLRAVFDQRIQTATEAARIESGNVRRELNAKLMESQVALGSLQAELRQGKARIETLAASQNELKTLSTSQAVEVDRLKAELARAETGRLRVQHDLEVEAAKALRLKRENEDLQGANRKVVAAIDRSRKTESLLARERTRVRESARSLKLEVLESGSVESQTARNRLGELFDERDRLDARIIELEAGVREQVRRMDRAPIENI